MHHQENSRHDATEEPVQAVTFDVTHTLIHAPNTPDIYRSVLRRHGLTASSEDLQREIPWVWKEFSCQADPRYDRFSRHAKGAKGWWQDFLARVCQRLELPPPTPFAGAELFDRFAHAEAWEIYDDVRPALQYLRRRGLRLAVVSNWDHRLPELLDRLGLLPYFDAVIYSAAVGVEKPHGKIFRNCLEELGVSSSRAMHVGDQAIEDIEGALALGMRALRVDRRDGDISLIDLMRPMLRRRVSKRTGWGTGSVDEGRHVLR